MSDQSRIKMKTAKQMDALRPKGDVDSILEALEKAMEKAAIERQKTIGHSAITSILYKAGVESVISCISSAAENTRQSAFSDSIKILRELGYIVEFSKDKFHSCGNHSEYFVSISFSK